MDKRSDLPGFYAKNLQERRDLVAAFASLTDEERALFSTPHLDPELMIENSLGAFPLPFGIATNFRINGRDYLIPLVIEEPSVVAAASHGAKLARPTGFRADADRPVLKSMVQLVGVPDLQRAVAAVRDQKPALLSACHEPSMAARGGGVFDLEPRIIETGRGPMLIVDIFCDCVDAMGANLVNTAAEKLAPLLEELTGGSRRLMIVSNLADRRLARAEATWSRELLGDDLIEGILDAQAFAEADPYRCATQNKGTMNGIDAVCIATGNDFRALEAGAHAYAARDGHYRSLTAYEKTPDGDLRGRIKLPLAVGIVGGSTKTNRLVQVALKILGVRSGRELAGVMAAVGLAQNFAALRAQVAEGIQKGHMKLHAKNLAVAAGAQGEEIPRVAARLAADGTVTASHAAAILRQIRQTAEARHK
ncbi:MAG: hydroxymethylglutaryl-CoA reductase, degradative [Candidatus Aenigmarchaeota archaeon]|nr:hydroxymethylglutaryl-CoA reductase, degradative [Candidatus Aenigmarchaeota archaeon]